MVVDMLGQDHALIVAVSDNKEKEWKKKKAEWINVSSLFTEDLTLKGG